MEAVLLMTTAVGLLVNAVWMMRAYLRGQHHVTARLAAVAVLLITTQQVTRFLVNPDSVPAGALAIAGVALAMMMVGVALGRFHSPR